MLALQCFGLLVYCGSRPLEFLNGISELLIVKTLYAGKIIVRCQRISLAGFLEGCVSNMNVSDSA